MAVASLAPPQVAAPLAAELGRVVAGEVRFDAGSRALYSTDASNYRQVPIGVVIPRTVDDVIATVATCARFGVPILSRGGGTSLAGQCCNVAVVMDFSKYLNRILEIDPRAHHAVVEPGVVLDSLRDAAEAFQLTFAPDPSTHTHNTLGGMIGNNSCGVHSVMGGKTVDNVVALDVLTYDGLRMTVGPTSDAEYAAIVREGGRRGQIYAALKRLVDTYAEEIRLRYPRIPRRVSGYNLDDLLPENGFNLARALVGTESTCVTILGAKVRLVPSPPARSLLVLGYPDVFQAADHVCDILAQGPIGLEGIDDRLVADMKAIGLHPEDVQLLPPGQGWLLAEFGGQTRAESDGAARACMAVLEGKRDKPSMKLFDDPAQEAMLWTVREAGLGATAHVPNKKITWEGWEDAAVAPEKLGSYLRDFRALLNQHHYQGDLYGHFGQGCVHTRIDFDLETQPGIDRFHAFLSDAADLVVRYGGSFSGEHGDGQSKAEFLPRMFGERLVQAFGEFKAIFDPDNRMNPGKIVHPYLPTQNLRLGAHYNPKSVRTYFGYPKDGGRFNRALLRCVGVGNCRSHHGGTMCPSYRATMEEKHSTRGRSRLLFEMMRGDVLRDGFRSEAVKDALHLCLSCKGCKGDCPVHVDMATYRAEFMSRYYAGRLRPLNGYMFGYIDRVARVASHAPALFNALTNAPALEPIARRLLGVSPKRHLPRVAAHSFVSQFRPDARDARDPRVLLWPDTFDNYFQPAVAHAAVSVLRGAGFGVTVPTGHVCCGRPLYEFGFLDSARAYLRGILRKFAREIDDGLPFVVLEPACASVFRDELTDLLPDDERAKRLSMQTFFWDEFLDRHAPSFRPLPLRRQAVVHAHCHHKALRGRGVGGALLTRAGLDGEVLDSGCCGMAGSFGYEHDKYDVSIAAGEHVLLPRVRAAGDETLIVADGYSCREQIAQCTSRTALHPAQVLAMAMGRSGSEP